ncbi:hypothetical protein THOG11_140031 [Vibrio harveyi]|nr:hypothetical protein TH15OA1_480158 [Vibrio harveyi]CAH1550984.1 hypothetical protein THOD03_150031 [Vibrio harveyi]CAH1554888.1 hypothetical protein THOG11_140031 [Vibrio harveyi]
MLRLRQFIDVHSVKDVKFGEINLTVSISE